MSTKKLKSKKTYSALEKISIAAENHNRKQDIKVILEMLGEGVLRKYFSPYEIIGMVSKTRENKDEGFTRKEIIEMVDKAFLDKFGVKMDDFLIRDYPFTKIKTRLNKEMLIGGYKVNDFTRYEIKKMVDSGLLIDISREKKTVFVEIYVEIYKKLEEEFERYVSNSSLIIFILFMMVLLFSLDAFGLL